MKSLHLYCVVGSGMELDSHPIGLDGHQVFAIRHRDLAALVSPAPVRAYKSMKREDVVPYLFAHQALIEKIMEDHTVVPVKFGTMAQDEGEVRKMLEKGSCQLTAALQAMAGRIELDLVAQWRDLNSVLRQIGEEPEIRRQKAVLAITLPHETREKLITIGQMVHARLDQMREDRAAEIVEALKPLAQDLSLHALLDDRMLLNTAFLVEREREGEVGEIIDRMNGQYGDSIDFRCVGPLPPYSFATVEIKTFEFETIDRARWLLGLREDAGQEELRDAYRRLVRQCHPDASLEAGNAGRDAAGSFDAINEAYRLLGEYRQVGSSFRAPDVKEAVAVRILQWSRESGGA